MSVSFEITHVLIVLSKRFHFEVTLTSLDLLQCCERDKISIYKYFQNSHFDE